MAIQNITYSNTFGQWLISTNQTIDEVNTLKDSNYTKSGGTLYLNSPSVGLSVGNNALFSGNTTFSGGLSRNISFYIPSYFYNTLTIDSNTSIIASGNVLCSFSFANTVIANTGTITTFNSTNAFITNGYLNLGQINNVIANTGTITNLNSLNFSSNTISANTGNIFKIFANTINTNTLTANNITFGDYTLSLGGNLITANSFTTSGNFPLRFIVSANSTLTLPPGANTLVASGFIFNADINASAAIVDTKLATISTAGKVSNSATTANSSNGSLTIVARDANGDFSTRQITVTANVSAGKFIGDGSGLTNLSITNLGSGIIPASLGGTGANNIGKSITLGGSITTSGNVTTANSFTTTGNFPLSFTTTASSTLTLPSGTKTLVASGDIVNADINASAAISDTKLATISTAGKVSNSSTTANSSNVVSTIVARDSSGNFAANQITASDLILNDANNTTKGILLKSSNLNRWEINSDNSTESGSNAGSNFNINRYSDAGSLIDAAVSINRTTGATTVKGLTINGDLVITGNTTTSGASISDAGQFVLRANTGTVASANSEFIVKRNSSDPNANNATIRWDNVGNSWEVNNVTTNQFYNILTDDSTLISVSKLGTGTPNNSNVLKGDGTWGVVGATITPDNSTNFEYNIGLANAVSGMWTTAYVANSKFTFNPSSGTLTTTEYVGSGARLTNINAANVTSGILSGDVGVLSGSSAVSFVKYTGGSMTSGAFNGSSSIPSLTTRLNYEGYFYATRFYGDGSFITNINAANVTSGTIATARLGSGTANGGAVLRGDNTWGHISYVNAGVINTGTLLGDRGITSGSASNSFIRYAGTTATAGQFDGGTTVPSGTTRLNYGGYLFATRFYGDGSNLTNLDAANVSSGTVANTRLGSGTANSQTVLYGDSTWKTVVSGATISNDTATNSNYYPLWSTTISGTPTTIYTSNTKLYFNPSTGTLNATIFNSLSDKSQKTDIKLINNAIEKVSQIEGVEFNWVDNGKKSAGVIAQQLEQILPHLVDTDIESGLKSVNYSGLIGYLIQSIKELSVRVEELENK